MSHNPSFGDVVAPLDPSIIFSKDGQFHEGAPRDPDKMFLTLDKTITAESIELIKEVHSLFCFAWSLSLELSRAESLRAYFHTTEVYYPLPYGCYMPDALKLPLRPIIYDAVRIYQTVRHLFEHHFLIEYFDLETRLADYLHNANSRRLFEEFHVVSQIKQFLSFRLEAWTDYLTP